VLCTRYRFTINIEAATVILQDQANHDSFFAYKFFENHDGLTTYYVSKKYISDVLIEAVWIVNEVVESVWNV